jgi:hypothetical protein
LSEKKYTKEGYLVVAESDKCPLWEKTTRPCNSGWTRDCFFCKYADFRTPEFIQRAEEEGINGKLYSVCHNEKNKNIGGKAI